MATKASATFIICQVLPSTPLIRPAIATLAELAGRMAAVCQHHYKYFNTVGSKGGEFSLNIFVDVAEIS